MSILDELMTIDFDDISHEEENTINETINKEPIKVESQKRKDKTNTGERKRTTWNQSRNFTKSIVHKTSGGRSNTNASQRI